MSIKKMEKYWVDSFVNAVKNQTGKKIIITNDKSEKPDFEILIDGVKVGLEVTELYQDNCNPFKGSKLKQDQEAVEKFTTVVINEIQKITGIKFVINIRLNQSKKIGSKGFKFGPKVIAEVCARMLQDMEDKTCFTFPNFNLFPNFIESIDLWKNTCLELPFNGSVFGGVLPHLSKKQMQLCITRKDELLKDYTKNEETWLLIGEGRGFAGSFSTIDISDNFSSHFDKIFVYRAFNHELIELNVYEQEQLSA